MSRMPYVDGIASASRNSKAEVGRVANRIGPRVSVIGAVARRVPAACPPARGGLEGRGITVVDDLLVGDPRAAGRVVRGRAVVAGAVVGLHPVVIGLATPNRSVGVGARGG